jgi:hypothetical protein
LLERFKFLLFNSAVFDTFNEKLQLAHSILLSHGIKIAYHLKIHSKRHVDAKTAIDLYNFAGAPASKLILCKIGEVNE